MKLRLVSALACCLILSCHVNAQVPEKGPVPTATMEDAIRMVRIQYNVALDGSVAAISPDGEKAAAVTWRGDIERNLNVYTLLVFDIRRHTDRVEPRKILSRDFIGEQADQLASPFSQLRFLGDNRTLAFIGRDSSNVPQVYTVDTATGTVKQLTQHPTAVRSFVLDPAGKLLAFSAVASANAGSRFDEDGIFVRDTTIFPSAPPAFAAWPLLLDRVVRREVRQYFFAGSAGPQLFFDSRSSRPAQPPDLDDAEVASSPTESLENENVLRGLATLTGDPQGKHALLFPYGLTDHPMNAERYAYFQSESENAFSRRLAAPYGLVDVATGRIERLLDAPHPPFERDESGEPLWTPDGRSVLIYTLSARAPAEPPQWVEVDIATRKTTPLGLPKAWRPVAWSTDQKALAVVGKGGKLGTLHRSGKRWGRISESGATPAFNLNWPVAVDSNVILGVKDATLRAPELVVYDRRSGDATTLTDLNPQLRQRRYGSVELLHWEMSDRSRGEGFLIKPVDYRPGNRYPLVVLLDDGTLGKEGEAFLLDACWQLSGHGVQMLSAAGFMVLYTREPPLRAVVETFEEGERMLDSIETAIAHLDRAGLIDPKRVGLSGWSRAGYYTDYLLIHSSFAFAAATAIDGGSMEYNDGMRPFTDAELQRIRTPKLFEAHELDSLVSSGAMADRMRFLGKPAEILYFGSASHSTTRPQHRLRSLGTHLDWWRFWLNGAEDADPAKAEQYKRWRKLRDKWSASGSAGARLGSR